MILRDVHGQILSEGVESTEPTESVEMRELSLKQFLSGEGAPAMWGVATLVWGIVAFVMVALVMDATTLQFIVM